MPIATYTDSLGKSDRSQKPVEVFVIGKDIFPRPENQDAEVGTTEGNLSLDEVNTLAKDTGMVFSRAEETEDFVLKEFLAARNKTAGGDPSDSQKKTV